MNFSNQSPSQATFAKPFWEQGLLAAIFLLALGLRLWGLDKNGFGNPYYAAAVRSMMMSWHNFFFVSFDPTGFVTVDKPPVSLWIQTAFAKLFGYKAFFLILPQIIEGLFSIGLVYHLVRRRFGAGAALLAALVLAVCPISVAVDRFNNTDACLVMVLLLAAVYISRAAEEGKLKFLLAATALVGIGFNTKMMMAFIVLPTFYALYLLGAPVDWKKRLKDLTLASLVLTVVALSWPLAVDLTPAAKRPFVGSSLDNSVISLALGWNGFQRLTRGRGRRPQLSTTQNASIQSTTQDPSGSLAQPSQAVMENPAGEFPRPRGQGHRREFNRMGMGTGDPGPLRLADSNMAGQVAWFLPLCLVGLWIEARRAKKSLPLSFELQSLLLWGGWFLTYAVVLSFTQGAMHNYYLVTLAPPLAALTGVGVRALWLDFTRNRSSRLLPLSLLLAGVWQAFIVAYYPEWGSWMIPALLIGIAIALVGFSSAADLSQPRAGNRIWAKRSLALGLGSLFLAPFAWALTPVLGSGASVEANPYLIIGDDGGRPMPGDVSSNINTDKLLHFLQTNHQDEKYLVAAQNSMAVSPLIIKTGASAIALGGFSGRDPICTVEQLEQMVEDHQLRYFLLGGMGSGNAYGQKAQPNLQAAQAPNAVEPNGAAGWGGFGNPGGFQADILKWVRKNGEPVDPKLWRVMDGPKGAANEEIPSNEDLNGGGGFGGRHGGSEQLYDLRPSD